MKFILATNNKGKKNDFIRILGKEHKIFTMEDMNINSDPEETGKTFAQNAIIKATALKEELDKRNIKDLIVLAEDSGLIVHALPNKLGVFTARYSGDTDKNTRDDSNNKLLLKEMENEKNRDAQYKSVICAVFLSGEKRLVEGCMDLTVGYEIKKGISGFAYDFVLISKDYNKYVSFLTNEERDSISHRALAIKALKKICKEQ